MLLYKFILKDVAYTYLHYFYYTHTQSNKLKEPVALTKATNVAANDVVCG